MNDMTFSQAATVLNEVVAQATGQKAIAGITTPEQFVAVAQIALKTGYDPLISAVSQVWSRTIFAVRRQRGNLRGLEMDMNRYGNAVRKLSPITQQMVDDQRFTFPVAYDAVGHVENPYGDGESVDMWKISKQKVLQTNFYGTAVYQQRFTIFKDQFDAAFSSADEFSRFNAMNMTERDNERENYRENVARAMQANFVGALIAENDGSRVIKLLTEYNAATGLELTAQSVYAPENYAAFIRWVYARINTLKRMFNERSEMFQTVIGGKRILRKTDSDNLRVALYAPAYEQIKSMALSTTYNDELLDVGVFEPISFWQDIKTPDKIMVTPVYTDTDGAVKKGEAVEQSNVFGILHDRDALGYAPVNNWNAVTPLNIDGGYWNESYHTTFKAIQDNTEKACVLLLE